MSRPTLRPFRFSVQTAQVQSAIQWTEGVRELEALGYSAVLMADTTGQTLAPMTALAVAAASTTRLRVSPYVLANDFRNPVLVAREAATLDFLTDGRVELGLGAGRPGVEADNRHLGIRTDPVGVRGERLAESVDIIARLFAGEKVTSTGGHYAIEEAELFPKPVQRPRPPILIAAGGPRALRRAARQADIVTIGAPANLSPEGLAERVGWIREGAGERFDALELNATVVALPEGPEAAGARQTAAGYARYMGLDLDALVASGRPTPLLMAGSTDRMVEHLLELRETYGISYVSVGGFAARSLAPVVARLAGT
ncbi:MAG: TIGR03621 family F420-dependent LLM class oxidoreductase [Candidatus Dormibacteraeota bacterium]|nr:TIGR03621 family F420-dependent LLM class oxidoreductase [Candidatus Dormibacteraeota bacterium]